MNNQLISIIVPNFNSASYIEETLNSILEQTHENWEAIIVDDGSTDNSKQLILEYTKNDNRIKLHKRKTKNKGASVCRNIGINNAKGYYIIFLDSDDILAPFCLEKRVLKMQTKPNLDFAVFNMAIFNKTIGDNESIVNKYSERNEYLKMFLEYDLPWPITAPIWKSSFLNNNNIKFDERYQRLQDPEFHTKILIKHKPKYHFFNESEPDCFYRQPQLKLKYNEASVSKLIEGLTLYHKNVFEFINNDCKKKFFINTIHTLLFYYKQKKYSPIRKYINSFNNKDIKISNLVVKTFYLFNKFGFTFIKGAGISRLWNIMIRK